MYIIDSTLVECHLTLLQKRDFIFLLDHLGVNFVELNIKHSYDNELQEIQDLVKFKKQRGLRINYLINIDIKSFLNTNLQGDKNDIKTYFDSLVNIFNLHNNYIIIKYIYSETTICYIENILKTIKDIYPFLNIVFSIENYFDLDNSNLELEIISILDQYVGTIGINDSNGLVHNYKIIDCLSFINENCNLQISCSFRNDLSNAVSNSFIAINEGCDFITTSVLGLNGVTDLSGLICNIYNTYPEYLKNYNLYCLKLIELYISQVFFIPLPLTSRSNIITYELSNIMDQIMDEYSKKKMNDIVDKIFIFNKNMSFYNLKIFIYLYLPRVFIKLEDDYIQRLCDTIRNDILLDKTLYIRLNNDQDFCINYIMKYIK